MREEHILVGGRELVLERPDDPESLIDEERFEDDEFLPYWAEVWPSGLALAGHVARLELGGSTVLELGCGLGLPSLAAALAGGDVLATDWAPEALDLLTHNAAANGIVLTTAVLAWGSESVLPAPRLDLVLAADVLYEERNAEPLLRLLDRVVGVGGEALVADPGRRHAPGFFAAARVRGWALEEIAAEEIPRGGIMRMRRTARTTG